MAFKVTFNGVDKTSFVSRTNDPQIVLKQNERSSATLTLLPGFLPARFDSIILYDVDSTTAVYGGVVMQAMTEGFEQGSSSHQTTIECSDFMVYADWSFWSKTYSTTVTLKTVLQDVIADKLGAYGITLDASQDNGDTFDPFTVGSGGVGEKISDLLRRLATACNPPRVIQMSPLKAIRILVPGTNAAPFNISDAAPRCLNFDWAHSTFTPANKVTLVCGPSSILQPTQSWTVGAPNSYEVDIQAVVGALTAGSLLEGATTRTVSPPAGGGYYEFDSTVGKGTLTVGTGVKPANGTILLLVYNAVYPFTVEATSGATPVIEVQATDVNQLLLAPAQATADGMLSQLNQSPREATILTLDRGFQPNQAMTVTLTNRDVSGASFTITQVTAEFTEFYNLGARMWKYTLLATETTVYQGSYLDQMRSFLGGGTGTATAVSGSGGSGGVSGSGTIGNLAKWTAATTLGNSLISESGSTATVAGDLTATTINATTLNATIVAATALSGSLAASNLTGTLTDARVAQSNVTQHQAALSIAGSQLTGTIANGVQDNITRLGTIASGGTFAVNIIPSLSDTYDLGNSTHLWRNGYISQLNAVLFAKQTQSLYGGWLAVTKNAGIFAAAVASGNTTIDFGQAMTLNQFVLVRAADTGGTITEEYIKVGTLSSGTIYNVTRNLSGGGAKNWAIGTVYAVRGVSGDGWVELNAFDTPRLSVFTQGSAYNNSVENVRVGHLTGMPNSSSGIGVYMGDATNYVRWDGTAFKLVSAGCVIDSSGITLGVGPSAFDLTAALKFNRESSFGVGSTNVFGVWTQSSGGAYQDLYVENLADRSAASGGFGADAKADIYIKATGWSGSGNHALTATSIRVSSQIGVNTITLTASSIVAGGDISNTGHYLQSTSKFIYPGSVSGLTDNQTSFYLASHATYGLYFNTGLYSSGTIFVPNNTSYASITTGSALVTLLYLDVSDRLTLNLQTANLHLAGIINAGSINYTSGASTGSIQCFVDGVGVVKIPFN